MLPVSLHFFALTSVDIWSMYDEIVAACPPAFAGCLKLPTGIHFVSKAHT
jgi:hypothetical protein